MLSIAAHEEWLRLFLVPLLNHMSDNYYEEYFSLSSDLMLLLDSTGRVVRANQSFLDHMGYSAEEVTGHNMAGFTKAEEKEHLTASLERIVHSRKPSRIELRCVNREGDAIRCSYTFHHNEGQHILAVGRNLDAWHQSCNAMCKDSEALEQFIDEKTRDLKLTIAELEAFNLTVSHDLCTPLRAISGFSRAITQDYGDRLDDTGRDYLQRIRSNCERMTTLTEYLLQLSRLNRHKLRSIAVDLGQIADTVITDLQAAEPKRSVLFMRKGKMIVKGDRELLSLLVQNLLVNAWKYTATRAMAEIVFSSSEVDGEHVFSVVDNGVGFPNAQRDKLFILFQRLHNPDEYPGLGIGLATAQRVVQRHGGRIWAESCASEKTTFYFSLNNRA